MTSEALRAAAPGWERHPADVARFVVAAGVTGALVGFAWLFNDSIEKVSTDLVRLLRTVPDGLAFALVGIVQILMAVAAPVAVVWLAVRRRWRILGVAVIAAVAGAAVMMVVQRFLADGLPVDLQRSRVIESWLGTSAFPSAALLAAAAAVATAVAPFISRTWYRIAMYSVVGVAFLRVLTVTEVPINLTLILAVGVCVGSAVLIATGAPHRRVDVATVAEALRSAGLAVDGIEPCGEDRSAPSFRVHGADGSDTHVVMVGRDQRDQDLVLRAWRAMRLKGFHQRRPSGTPLRVVENEQLALTFAQAGGVAAARPAAIASTDDDAILSATTWVSGTRLFEAPDHAVDDDLLIRLWAQVAALHRRRIAHGWLNMASVICSDDGSASLVEFRRAAIDAPAQTLLADNAELLCSLATRFGIERTVRTAVAGIGVDDLAATLPLLQPLVISRETREALKTADVTLADLRDGLAGAVGAAEVTLAPVARVSLKGVVSLVGSIVLASYVFSLASDWRNIADAFGLMNWAAVPLLVAIVLVTNSGGALSMMGSVNVELSFMRTNQIMFAQGFLNRFTPANAGGMALRARYLQREGVELNVGAAAVGITSAASGLLQAVFIVVFLIWGGSSDQLSRFQFPSTTKVLGVIIAIAAVIGAIVLSSWGRRVVVPKVKETVGPAVANLVELARRPRKLAQLFGGAALAKISTIAAFALCVSAMGVDMDFARLGALYMVANTVGAAVPTPGGVGGIEAALTAALITGGVDAPTAGAIVLIFRLFTFWFPTLPGWACLQRAQRTGIV